VAEHTWPPAEKRSLLGKRISRLDGPDKVSGRAKYTYDLNRPGTLYGKIVRSPHAHSRVVGVDTSAAEAMPGVKAVHVVQGPGTEVFWWYDEIVALAAVDEPTAEDAARAIKVEYEPLPFLVDDYALDKAGANAKPAGEQVKGEPDKAFQEAEVTSEGEYGSRIITHCCLESHGAVCEWESDKNLLVHVSTQNVSGIAGQMAGPLGIPAGDIRVKMDHIGGGFGSKFGPDRWGIVAAQLSKKAGGKPVKMMLERDAEQVIAGVRPSIYGKVRMAARKDGTITAWQSESWGSGGVGGGGRPPLPYVLEIPNQRLQHTAIANHIGPARAWRAPNHPQACVITMGAFEDLAAKLGRDPYDLLLQNIALTGVRADIYKEELAKAAELIGWKKSWHPRGDKTAGPVKRGLGLSIHTWGGRGHDSNCDLTIQPDGSVEVKMGTQDLGTGTRTCIPIVVADTLGLPLEAINFKLGDNQYPTSGGSGGSTTIGGVSASSRIAALDALDKLFEAVAPALGAQPAELEAVGGKVQVKGNPAKALPWAQACARLGGVPLTVRGTTPKGQHPLLNSGVGGVQMADVSVDVETGRVRINTIVAVQDCGLVVDLKLAESQVYGALIMGVSYALYEEKVTDPLTGRMLNPNMEFYKLAGLADVGELVVHMMTGKGYDERGVIGLGEPPVVSPGAVISNAVANAIGVRVPHIPLTPQRVLAALATEGRRA
jgi:xanthine dehydrogenase YagR molybdenum-binding subunit